MEVIILLIVYLIGVFLSYGRGNSSLNSHKELERRRFNYPLDEVAYIERWFLVYVLLSWVGFIIGCIFFLSERWGDQKLLDYRHTNWRDD